MKAKDKRHVSEDQLVQTANESDRTIGWGGRKNIFVFYFFDRKHLFRKNEAITSAASGMQIMQPSILLQAASSRSTYVKDEDFTAKPMSDHPHGEKKNIFLFEILWFATCAHHISSCHCAPFMRVTLHLPPATAAFCRSCGPCTCLPGSPGCSLQLGLRIIEL